MLNHSESMLKIRSRYLCERMCGRKRAGREMAVLGLKEEDRERAQIVFKSWVSGKPSINVSLYFIN